MKFSFPIRTAGGAEYKNAEDVFKLLRSERSGQYLLGKSNFWHGGIHFTDKSAPHCKSKEMIRCIGDGEVVAYRLRTNYLQSSWQGAALQYSTDFCLVRHHYLSPAVGEGKGVGKKNELTFFSLYMHLAPMSAYAGRQEVSYRIKVTASGLRVRDQASLTAVSLGTIDPGAELTVVELREVIDGNAVYCFAHATLQSKSIRFMDKNRQSKPGDKIWLAVNKVTGIQKENFAEFVTNSSNKIPGWWQCKARALIHSRVNARDGVGVSAKRLGLIAIGTEVEYDPATVTELSFEGKKRKFAECTLIKGGFSGSNIKVPPRFWLCIDADFTAINSGLPSQLDKIVTCQVKINAGDPIGHMGLYESANASGKSSQYRVHLEVFSGDRNLKDFLQNKAGIKQEPYFIRLAKGSQLFGSDGKAVPSFSADGAALEQDCVIPLGDARKIKDKAKAEWFEVSVSDKTCDIHGYIKAETADIVSQHDWEKLGFKTIKAPNNFDGHLDKNASAPFFKELYQNITGKQPPADREAIRNALAGPEYQKDWSKIVACHPSEWKANANDSLWSVLNVILHKAPDRHQHEKERIDQAIWWDEVAGKVEGLPKDGVVWHFHPVGFVGAMAEAKMLIWMKKVVERYGVEVATAFKSKVIQVGENLSIDPDYIMACIALETGVTFNPAIKNPRSSATGLIQFMESTAEWLGTTTSKLSRMSHLEQMTYVELYFVKIAAMVKVPTFKWTLGDVYFSIFTPSIIKMGNDEIVYSRGQKEYEVNKFHDRDKNGVITKSDISLNIKQFYDKGASYKW